MITIIKDYIKNLIHKKNNVFPLTENHDGFLFFLGNSDTTKQLLIDPKKIAKTIKYINKKKILSIAINDAYFEKLENLEFLKEISNIEEISVLQDDLDLKPIENLINLKSLSFGNTKEILNLTGFQNLEILGCDYRKVENLKDCRNLKSIKLHFFNRENLMELQNLKKLESLFLYRTAILNFNGIESHRNIIQIELYNSPKLETLNGLPTNSEKLEVLYIYNAKKLTDYERLKSLNTLKRLQLVSGGIIENLDVFEQMENLEYLQLGMGIRNGNKVEFMKNINKK